ncbi:DUF4124 domain-containing protein [Paraglaciecola aquimarina]|uniref:DUF4124 domain-containing protein n=1 Tax=Paraglaciecola aquimarina TaxID=1235557 RepID=A0ABU3T1A1_9ALTE|nr:DUF4124 domain-containing protein [Paraglaciecola aquimarina]MDU0356023.1 DUF4124 domain-containing protein [Paraglaciecola aquimarina]
MRPVFLIGLLFCATVAAKDVYKTTQPDGTVMYSDMPVTGSTRVDLSTGNRAVIPALTSDVLIISQQAPLSTNVPVRYQVSIVTPADEQTIRDNSGAVNIRASLSVKGEGAFQLMLDDRLHSEQSSPLFSIKNVNRGAHTLQVHFINNSGKILASSPQQVFYLQKTTALFNAN